MVRALKSVVRGCTCVYTLEYSKGVMGFFMQHGCDEGSSKSFEDRGTYAFAHLAIGSRPVLCRMRLVECSLVMLRRCTGSHWASFRGASEVR